MLLPERGRLDTDNTIRPYGNTGTTWRTNKVVVPDG